MSTAALGFAALFAIEVLDLDRAVGFYTRALGFRLRVRVGDDWAEATVAGVTVAFRRFRGRSARARESGAFLALEVEDLSRAIAELRARGIEPEPGVRCDGLARAALVRDPDGHRILLRESLRPPGGGSARQPDPEAGPTRSRLDADGAAVGG